MGRAPCCDKANVKRGPWSPEEDAALKSYLERHGTGGNWIALPQKAGLKRCGKSCRLRWLNYLRPDIKHGGFTEEEDTIICNLYINIGSRWSVIASKLPGRTDNDVKNYWNTKLKKKLMAAGGQTTQLPTNMITSNNSTHMYTPTPSLIPAAAAKTEPKILFTMPPERTMDSGYGFPELMPYTMLGAGSLMDDFSGISIGHATSPPEDFSAASSSVTLDNSSSTGSNTYFNWSSGDGLFIDSGFGSFSDLLAGCDSPDKMISELGAPCYATHVSSFPSLWSTTSIPYETKPFHTISFS